MKIWGVKNLIVMIALTLIIGGASQAESLFSTGISENQAYGSIQPRSLYNYGRARSVGDIVTIEIDETITSNDEMKYKLTRNSELQDKFSPLINKALPEKWRIPEELNGFGGGQSVDNTIKRGRSVTYKNTVTAQVTQVLPNGNLLVQGKKATLNNGEKVNLIISGIVDPRWIGREGSVSSSKVANLQIAIVGDGTVSRSDNEGLVNKFVRFLF